MLEMQKRIRIFFTLMIFLITAFIGCAESNPPIIPPTILTQNLPNAVEGIPYNFTLESENGKKPVNWNVNGLPSGLTCDMFTGEISGTADFGTSLSSPYIVDITVTDQNALKDNITLNLVVEPSLTPHILTSMLPTATVSSPYSFTLQAVGGSTPYNWTVTGLPSSMTYNSATGEISGTPDSGTPGSSPYSIDVTLTDNNLNSDNKIISLEVRSMYCWTKTMGSIFMDGSTSVCADGNDNIYLTGYFEGTINFAEDWGGSDIRTSRGGADIFVTKINSNDNYCWTYILGGSLDDRGLGICADRNDNIYLTGCFEFTVNFAEDWGGVELKTSNGVGDIFITKIDSNGNYCWTHVMGEIDLDWGLGICMDINNDVYVTGFFWSTSINFAADWGGSDVKLCKGTVDMFITKLDTNGNYCWTHVIGGSSDVRVFAICSDSIGNVYFTGAFLETVNFAEDWGSTDSRTNINFFDLFITKIEGNGNYCWTKTIGGPDNVYGASICTDKNDNIYVTGFFKDTVNFADDWGGIDSKTCKGERDIFITKIDSNCIYCWSHVLGDSGDDYGIGICTDTNNDIYITGFFGSSVNFAEDWIDVDFKTSKGIGDIFITKIDSNADYCWTHVMGGLGGEGGRSVSTNSLNDIYITGAFQGNINFAEDWGNTDSKSCKGFNDIFITKIQQ